MRSWSLRLFSLVRGYFTQAPRLLLRITPGRLHQPKEGKMHRSAVNGAGLDEFTGMMAGPVNGMPPVSAGGLGPVWARSSRSANNGNCVEVARLRDGRIGVRDSKDARGPVLAFSRGAWASFLKSVQTGIPGR